MNGNDQFLGIVKNGAFQLLVAPHRPSGGSVPILTAVVQQVFGQASDAR